MTTKQAVEAAIAAGTEAATSMDCFHCEDFGCELCSVPELEAAESDPFGPHRAWAITEGKAEAASEQLASLVEQRRALDYEIGQAIGLLKVCGWSWAMIAEGVADGGKARTKQAAMMRYRVHVEQFRCHLLDAAAEGEGGPTREALARLFRRWGARPARYRWAVCGGDRWQAARATSYHWSPERAEGFAKARASAGGTWSVWEIDPRPTMAPTLRITYYCEGEAF